MFSELEAAYLDGTKKGCKCFGSDQELPPAGGKGTNCFLLRRGRKYCRTSSKARQKR